MDTYLDRIKLLKNEKKITNEHLADMTGIPLGTLSKILAGMSDSPKFSNILSICEALDCSVEYIASGTPDNTNNYTLTSREIEMVERFRSLDFFGQDLILTVLEKEHTRAMSVVAEEIDVEERFEKRSAHKESAGARVLRPLGRYAGKEESASKRSILLYELPVSAGVGVYLDEETAQSISVPDNEKTAEASYALRISGNSMEPKYHDGDILLVQSTESVEVGELGIFLLDGCAFFKIFGGDRLLSLNPEYAPIALSDFDSVRCKGRVVGRLKRK